MKYMLLLLALAPALLASPVVDVEQAEEETLAADCVISCEGRKDGRYTSCLGCDVFAMCAGGELHDNQPCPAGTYWAAKKRTCNKKAKCENPITRKTVCEKTVMMPLWPNAKLRCPAGRAIQVVEALFGRQTMEICFHANPIQDLHCGDKEKSTKIVSKMCDGKQSCEVKPSTRVFGNPCRTTWKYLEIKYTCNYAR